MDQPMVATARACPVMAQCPCMLGEERRGRSADAIWTVRGRTERALKRERDAEEGQDDDGQQAVPQDGADAPDVDLLDGEQVQHEVHGQAARHAEAVDVPEVHLCVCVS